MVLLLVGSGASATHMSGGEIYWECIGPNQFRIKLVVYRDCAGINVDPSYNLQLTSPCGNRTLTVTTPGGVEISQLCDIQLPNSTCNGGTLPGIQQYEYTGTITLPPCDSWSITWTNIYRNNAIVNLTNPGTREMYIEGVLNSAAAPCNDSPTFTNTAIPYVCLGFPVSFSYGAYDPEADSLSYSLIGARMLNAAPVPYTAGNSATAPIPGIMLNPTTGLINFTLNVAGNWVVVVLVTQYDGNGNVIGTIMRDMQFVAYPCSNIPPDAATGLVTNLTGTAVQTGPRAITVCESGNFCFDMVITDANAGNILTATTNLQQNLPGATISYSGTNPITANICWNAQANTAGFYAFIVSVNDGACPIPAIQTYVYSVRVLAGLAATIATTDEACAGTADGTVSTSIVTGSPPYTYSWSNGATTPSITAGPGTYSVTISDGNNCVSHLLTGTIGTTGLPNAANAGPDLVGCADALPVQLSGSVVNATGGAWSGGAGSITGPWSTAQYQPTPQEISAGSVQLTLTTTGNTTCPPGTDVVTISLPNSFATQSITGTNALCYGGNSGTATFSPNDPGFSYAWNDPQQQTTATATGLAMGDYTVSVTDTYGCNTQMSITLSQPAALAIANISSTTVTCTGAGNGSATVTPSGGTPPYTYLWSTGATTATTVAGVGTHSVTVSDANNCAAVTAQVDVTANGSPNAANAGPDLIGCMGAPPIQLSGSVVNATGGSWSGGTGNIIGSGMTASYAPSSNDVIAGGVDLYLTTSGNTSCPPDVDTIHITLSNSYLYTQLNPSAALCNSASDGTIMVTPAIPGLIYQWNDAAQQTTAIATGLNAGTYTVLITDQLGCNSSFSATITEPTTLSTPSINTVDVSCPNGNNGSATVMVTGGTPPYSTLWSTGSTSTMATGLMVGNYGVTVTDSNGCTAQGNVSITEPPPIVLTAQGPGTICVNSLVQLTAQASGGTGDLSYNWNGLGFNDTINVAFSASQSITVTVTDQAGCSGPSVTLPITVLDLSTATLTTYGDTTVCSGGTGSIGATLSNYSGSYLLSWTELGTNSSGPFTVPITENTVQHVVVTDQCGNTLAGSVSLQIETPPNVELPPIIAEACAPYTTHFPNLQLGNVTALWDLGNGTTSNQASPVVNYPPGTYQISLTVTTPLGCTATSPAYGQVIIHAPPTAAFTASSWEVDFDNALIQFTDQSVGTITNYAWTFGDGGTSEQASPAHNYGEPGYFQVELYVEDQNGCTSIADHTMHITPVYDIVIPTAFTPDPNGGAGGQWVTGDLSNDVFYPFVRFVDEFNMRVFNRWGELIFESDDLKIGWDGFYRGEMCPQDMYVVQTWYKFLDGKEIKKLSDLTLIR